MHFYMFGRIGNQNYTTAGWADESSYNYLIFICTSSDFRNSVVFYRN